jgi:cytosine/adenosine deaminase-related metal-dependent hydrolase
MRAGRIAAISVHGDGEPPAGVRVVDGRGGVLSPAFADAHTHLDSTRLGLPFRPHTAEPGLRGLIDNDWTGPTGARPVAPLPTGRREPWAR